MCFWIESFAKLFPQDYNLVLDIDNDENQKYSEFINNPRFVYNKNFNGSFKYIFSFSLDTISNIESDMVFYYVNDKIINDNKDKLRDINLFSEYHPKNLLNILMMTKSVIYKIDF